MTEPPPLSPSPPAPHARPRPSGLAIFALVMSCLFFIPFCPLLGLILGIVALVKARPGEPRGVAIAAVAVGPVAFFFLQAMCAAIAIPSFLKYIRRAKSVEASLNVRKLADAVSVYYAELGRMPPPTDWTPAGTACGHEKDRFPADASAWSGAPWKELNFSIDGPHYYQYRIQKLGPTIVEIQARGDLNCDGIFSQYSRSVSERGPDEPEVQNPLE